MLDLNPTGRIMGRMKQTTTYLFSIQIQKHLWNKEERNYHAINEKTDWKISAIILNLTTI